ncbi:MAG: hypothetical protein RL071_2259 [Pseudomonadota bacterium]|jgi:uncharacterized membrane protein YbaN (DUF454 family)
MSMRLHALTRPLWLALGWAALALAVIGAILPVMPSTCFVLVAAWAFGRSSPRLAAWLRGLPVFGRVITDWERERAMPLWAKAWAMLLIGLSFGLSVAVSAERPWLQLGLIAVGLGLVTWIARLPRPGCPVAVREPA